MFPYDANTAAYLEATRRAELADAANAVADDLRADPDVERDPERYFDQVIEIDLSTLAPLVNGPDTPDLAHAVSEVGSWARANGVPTRISSALIGSCTNSSYEDITRAASIARHAAAHGLRAKTQLFVTPGSEQVRATIERDGLLADLEAIGATVLANACGPCIGQWDRPAADSSTINTIVTSYNRNFSQRNDGQSNTKAFVTSPETVIAFALAGTLEFDPLAGSIDGVRLEPPVGVDLPPRGFDPGVAGFLAPPESGSGVDVVVSPNSDRLQLLDAVPGLERRRLRRPPGAAEGQREVHDRPDLGRGQVAPVPGSPREHLGQSLRRGDQCVHRCDRARPGSARRRDASRSPTSRSTSRSPVCRGARSETTTTAKDPHESTPRWSRAFAAAS